jgi:hypothetical protein
MKYWRELLFFCKTMAALSLTLLVLRSTRLEVDRYVSPQILIMGFFIFSTAGLLLYFERNKGIEHKLRPFIRLIFALSLLLLIIDLIFSLGPIPGFHLYLAAVSTGFLTYRLEMHRIIRQTDEDMDHDYLIDLRKGHFWQSLARKGLGWEGIVLFGLVLLGAGLRFTNLGSLSLWGDEGNVYIASKNIIATGLPYLESGFLYLRDLAHLYITALSMLVFGENEIGLRLPSALAGTLLIIYTYLLSRKLLPKRFALIAAGIVAFHPWMIEHSRIARSYMLVVLLLTASVYYLSAKKRGYFMIASLLAVFTHQIGYIVLLLFIPSTFIIIQEKEPAFSRRFLKGFIIHCLPFIVIFITIFMSKMIFREGYYTASDQWKAMPASSGLLGKALSLVPLGQPVEESLLFILKPMPVLGILGFILAAIYLLHARHLSPEQMLLIGGTAAFVLTVYCSKLPVNMNRTILFLFPFFVIVSMLGLYHASILTGTRLAAVVVGFFAAALLLIPSLGIVGAGYGDPINPYHSAFEGYIFRQDHKTTYEYVNEHYIEGDIVLLYGVPQYSMLYADFPVDYRVWSGSTMTMKGRNYATNTAEINDSKRIEEIVSSSQRVWLITSISILSGTDQAPRVHHLSRDLLRQLDEYKANIIYVSEDSSARVYLVEKGLFSPRASS